MRTIAITTAALLAALLFATPATAQEIDGFWPACGAPGDPVMIKGSDFDEDPTVTFGDEEAEVLRSCGTAILCVVPEDLDEGDATISVDDEDADDDFVVLEEGAPVVYRLSAEKGTVGQPVFTYGRRLRGVTVSFVDEDGVAQATADLKGGWRAGLFEVPEDLDEGTYVLVFTNEDDQDSGDCSPEFEVVEAGDAALDSIDPEAALPGDRIRIEGNDLSPPGPCLVTWTDEDDETWKVPGISNGYGEVRTHVPLRAAPEATYDVAVVLRGGTETDSIEYELGIRGDPDLTELDPDTGPAGSTFAILGKNILVPGEKPEVDMASDDATLEPKIVFAHPGFGDKDDVLVVRVPPDADLGDYDVSVTVDGEESDALTFTVAEAELSVKGMKPERQSSRGPVFPVFIHGTGFGEADSEIKLAVVWKDTTKTYEGKVLFRSSTLLMVGPPGGMPNRLAKGTYVVWVVLDPDGDDEEEVKAGTYVVK